MKTFLILLTLLSCTPEQDIYHFTPVENDYKAFTAQVVNQINLHRETPIVESSNELTFYLAHQHSQRGILDHTGYDYRLETIRNHTNYIFASEVMAFGFENAESLVTAWLNSEGHKEMLLRNNKEVTIARHGQFITALFLK